MAKRHHGIHRGNKSWSKDIIQLVCILRLRSTPMVPYEIIANHMMKVWTVASLRWCGYDYRSKRDIPNDFDDRGVIHGYLCRELSKAFDSAEEEQSEVWMLAREWDEELVRGLLKMDGFEGKGFEIAEKREMEAQIMWRKEGDWKAGSEPLRPMRGVKETMLIQLSVSDSAVVRRCGLLESGIETTRLLRPRRKSVGAQDTVPVERKLTYRSALTGVAEGDSNEEAIDCISPLEFSRLIRWPSREVSENAIDDSYLIECNQRRGRPFNQESENGTSPIGLDRLKHWSTSPFKLNHPADSCVPDFAQDSMENTPPSALHPRGGSFLPPLCEDANEAAPRATLNHRAGLFLSSFAKTAFKDKASVQPAKPADLFLAQVAEIKLIGAAIESAQKKQKTLESWLARGGR